MEEKKLTDKEVGRVVSASFGCCCSSAASRGRDDPRPKSQEERGGPAQSGGGQRRPTRSLLLPSPATAVKGPFSSTAPDPPCKAPASNQVGGGRGCGVGNPCVRSSVAGGGFVPKVSPQSRIPARIGGRAKRRAGWPPPADHPFCLALGPGVALSCRRALDLTWPRTHSHRTHRQRAARARRQRRDRLAAAQQRLRNAGSALRGGLLALFSGG